MPAITRSQKKMNSTVVENQVTINIVEKPSAEKYKPSDNKVIVSATVDVRPIATEQSKSVKSFIKYVNDVCTKSEHYFKEKMYFENLRILTELYYYIYESFDTVLIVNGIVRAPNFQRLINTMSLKGVDLSTKVKEHKLTIYKEVTSEELYIMDCFLEQVKQTLIKLELYVKEKRNKKVVDYTGMDTIEPLDEYDAITNIWADETIDEDPDYEYETDEDDEDEDESEETSVGKKERAMKATNNLISSVGMMKPGLKEGQEFVVASNHFRFVY
jgi:hypothetical protein